MEERHDYTEHRPDSNSVVQEDQVKVSGEVLTCFSNEDMHSISDNQELGPTPEYISKNCDQQDAKSGIQRNMEEDNKKLDLGDVLSELSEKNNQIISKLAKNDLTEANKLLSSNKDTEKLLLPAEVAATSLLNECLELPSEDADKSYIEQMNPSVEDLNLDSSTEKLEIVAIKKVNNSRQLDHKDKKILKSKMKNYKLRSLASTDRVLRSRAQEKSKDPEPSDNLNKISTVVEGKKRRRKKKRNKKGKESRSDEFSAIRNRLRYLLNRIRYEQNLIDAYSSEGWKGFSSDKLKPEKELQRASCEIMRRKLKIRDLFQHLDTLCAEGRFSESLFDSEGQIDSEDIFCAKCGSKELSLENDIILCDGSCDRGFHQFCLEPPLLNTDFPPDDEGWLCPGCDCKDDCMDQINEFQGTSLSITDSWEKVYPEAAAAAAGRNSDNTLGLPSDDSEDDDYDPDAPDTVVQKDESSSDESGYASAAEELEAPPNDDQYLGLPSDDSEDDDFDPSAPDHDEAVNNESSSSDFTSDSEDLATLDDNRSSKSDTPMPPSLNYTRPSRNSNGQSSGHGPSNSALHNEVSTILDSGSGKNSDEPSSGRRQVERLDYKKLHDETYGNVSTDSSDETFGSDSSDDGGRGGSSSTRKRIPKKPVLLNNGTNDSNFIETRHNAKRRTRKKPTVENIDNCVANTPEDSQKSGSSSRRTVSTSAHRRLDSSQLERLLASFQENQYPGQATKESLAQQLGLSSKQVGKWFENTRWSTRHPSSVGASSSKRASRMGKQLSQTAEKLPNPEQESAQHKESPEENTVRQESSAMKSRKRKGRSNLQASRSKGRPTKSPKVNEIQTGDKAKIKRRKSV